MRELFEHDDPGSSDEATNVRVIVNINLFGVKLNRAILQHKNTLAAYHWVSYSRGVRCSRVVVSPVPNLGRVGVLMFDAAK